eukprot:RCo054904
MDSSLGSSDSDFTYIRRQKLHICIDKLISVLLHIKPPDPQSLFDQFFKVVKDLYPDAYKDPETLQELAAAVHSATRPPSAGTLSSSNMLVVRGSLTVKQSSKDKFIGPDTLIALLKFWPVQTCSAEEREAVAVVLHETPPFATAPVCMTKKSTRSINLRDSVPSELRLGHLFLYELGADYHDDTCVTEDIPGVRFRSQLAKNPRQMRRITISAKQLEKYATMRYGAQQLHSWMGALTIESPASLYGEESFVLDRKEAEELERNIRVYTGPNLPPAFFKRLCGILSRDDRVMYYQERQAIPLRWMAEVSDRRCELGKFIATLLEDDRERERYGFTHSESLQQTVEQSIAELATQVCVACPGYCFVSANNQIAPKPQQTILFLSAVGINFATGASARSELQKYFYPELRKFIPGREDKFRDRMRITYERIFTACQEYGVTHPTSVPIGLGNFLGEADKATLMRTIFDVIFDVLQKNDYKFETFYLNPGPGKVVAESLLTEFTFNFKCNLVLHDRDGKALASLLATAGYRTAYIHPSDPVAVMQGCAGNKWARVKGPNFGAEADLVSTSTALLARSNICSLWADDDDDEEDKDRIKCPVKWSILYQEPPKATPIPGAPRVAKPLKFRNGGVDSQITIQRIIWVHSAGDKESGYDDFFDSTLASLEDYGIEVKRVSGTKECLECLEGDWADANFVITSLFVKLGDKPGEIADSGHEVVYQVHQLCRRNRSIFCRVVAVAMNSISANEQSTLFTEGAHLVETGLHKLCFREVAMKLCRTQRYSDALRDVLEDCVETETDENRLKLIFKLIKMGICVNHTTGSLVPLHYLATMKIPEEQLPELKKLLVEARACVTEKAKFSCVHGCLPITKGQTPLDIPKTREMRTLLQEVQEEISKISDSKPQLHTVLWISTDTLAKETENVRTALGSKDFVEVDYLELKLGRVKTPLSGDPWQTQVSKVLNKKMTHLAKASLEDQPLEWLVAIVVEWSVKEHADQVSHIINVLKAHIGACYKEHPYWLKIILMVPDLRIQPSSNRTAVFSTDAATQDIIVHTPVDVNVFALHRGATVTDPEDTKDCDLGIQQLNYHLNQAMKYCRPVEPPNLTVLWICTSDKISSSTLSARQTLDEMRALRVVTVVLDTIDQRDVRAWLSGVLEEYLEPVPGSSSSEKRLTWLHAIVMEVSGRETAKLWAHVATEVLNNHYICDSDWLKILVFAEQVDARRLEHLLKDDLAATAISAAFNVSRLADGGLSVVNEKVFNCGGPRGEQRKRKDLRVYISPKAVTNADPDHKDCNKSVLQFYNDLLLAVTHWCWDYSTESPLFPDHPYSAEVSGRIEQAYRKGAPSVEVAPQRVIYFKDMLQRRTDDPMAIRLVSRYPFACFDCDSNVRAHPHLLKEIASGNCVVFIGAGFCVPADGPSWGQLLRDAAHSDKENTLLHNTIDELVIRGDHISLELAAQLIEDNMRKPGKSMTLQAFVAQSLDEKIRPGSYYCRNRQAWPVMAARLQHLQRLNFCTVLTTNYSRELCMCDDSGKCAFCKAPCPLSENASPAYVDILRYRPNHDEAEPPVIQIHGTVKEPETIVFTREGYRELLHTHPAYLTFMKNLMSVRTILYIGFSFTDDYLNEIRSDVMAMKVDKGLDTSTMAYAIINDKDKSHCTHYQQHEGVTFLTWDTKRYGFGVVDRYLGSLLKMTELSAALSGAKVILYQPTQMAGKPGMSENMVTLSTELERELKSPLYTTFPEDYFQKFQLETAYRLAEVEKHLLNDNFLQGWVVIFVDPDRDCMPTLHRELIQFLWHPHAHLRPHGAGTEQAFSPILLVWGHLKHTLPRSGATKTLKEEYEQNPNIRFCTTKEQILNEFRGLGRA